MKSFIIKGNPVIHFPKQANHKSITKMLNGYTLGINWQVVYDAPENTITIGNAEKILADEKDYALLIYENGVYINGSSYAGLMRGFVTFLEKVFCTDELVYEADPCEIKESPAINFRCVHICVFPETTYTFLQKSIRSAIIAKYTHVIVEFFGTLKLDSFSLLAWPDSFSKDKTKELFDEIRAFGIELIPFFQHWGHASLARGGASGKHVVLDQDMKYAYLYQKGTYGWAWDFKKDKTLNLLRDVRNELINLCGEGKFFHIGCDEAVSLKTQQDAMDVVNHINTVAAELKKQGRTAIIWGDMLLNASFLPDAQMHPSWGRICYDCNSTAEVANVFLNNLDKDNIIIADWEYDVTEQLWVSSKFFKEKGFRVICAPFSDSKNMKLSIDTVKENDLMGVMKTTWHTLADNEVTKLIHYGFSAYKGSHDPGYPAHSAMTDHTADILRKVSENNGEYKNYGWKQNQIEI